MQMNYVLLPSLEHSALARIVINLWTQDDMKGLGYITLPFIGVPFFGSIAWKKLENRVREKIIKLPLLPEILKKKLLNFIKPLGNEILYWALYHEKSFEILLLDSLNKLCWTSQWTIDVKKTAEILVRDENLDIVNRYKLACTYCLQDYIRVLWKQLNGKQFHGKNLRRIKEEESTLVSFWSYYMKGGLAQFDDILARQSNTYTSVYHYGFSCAVSMANKVATEYFLQKLTPEEKKQSLVKAALDLVSDSYCALRRSIPEQHYAGVFHMLLCHMNEQQQMEVFKKQPQYALQWSLDWPWQDFFIPTAEYVLLSLDESSYPNVLNEIYGKIIDNCKDYDYRKFFEMLLQKSVSIKNYFIEDCVGVLLLKLLKIGDVKTVKLLLSYATPFQKEVIIFCHIGKYICEELIFYDCKWNLLMMLVKECLPSKSLLVKFKKYCKGNFLKRTNSITSEEYRRRKEKFNEFALLLKGVIRGLDKRKNTEDEKLEKRLRTGKFQG